jgi:hypothetical protein
MGFVIQGAYKKERTKRKEKKSSDMKHEIELILGKHVHAADSEKAETNERIGRQNWQGDCSE